MLKSGEISLTTLNLLSPHLTEKNREHLLKSVRLKSKKEVEKIIAGLFPRNEVMPDKIRKLPTKHTVEIAYASVGSSILHFPKENEERIPARKLAEDNRDIFGNIPIAIGLRGKHGKCGSFASVANEKPTDYSPPFRMSKPVETIKPVTDRRYKIELSCSEELTQKIKREKDVLRHKYPESKLEDVLDEALEALLEKKDPLRKLSRRKSTHVLPKKSVKSCHPALDAGPTLKTPSQWIPRQARNDKKWVRIGEQVTTRYIPQAIKTAVWKRDGGQCTYVSAEGKRCSEQGGLELDHVHPYALGGEHSTQNLTLLCNSHNQWRAHKTFGFSFPSRKPISFRNGRAALMMEKG